MFSTPTLSNARSKQKHTSDEFIFTILLLSCIYKKNILDFLLINSYDQLINIKTITFRIQNKKKY